MFIIVIATIIIITIITIIIIIIDKDIIATLIVLISDYDQYRYYISSAALLSQGKVNARMIRRSRRFFKILLCIPPAVAKTT